ncbi:MAG: anthranilate synthase component I family protein [Spirochaetales bacterium]|nr:anthranilate synthase component I family protein [Spirochaetales bacterium]
MWNINVTTQNIHLRIELLPLFHTVTRYEGILLFSSHIPRGKNIAGFNPILKITENSIEYDKQKQRIDDPLKEIDSIISHVNGTAGLTGTTGLRGSEAGFLGYIAYDYKDRLEEPHLYNIPGQGLIGDLYFALFEYYLIYTTGSRNATIVTLRPSFRYRSRGLEKLIATIVRPPEIHQPQKKSVYSGTSLPKQKYEEAIKKTIGYIKAGDIYQANITRAINGRTGYTPEELAYRLYYSNRIEFGVYAVIGDTHVISTSPERFFKVDGNTILTSPIKGTIERTGKGAINRKNKKTLLQSEKNKAELAMIVDLLRNDISKICRIGSVKVKGFPILKELYNVYHLVADIEGILFPEIGFKEIIRGLFPGGSISGCPKIRACQIIEELEKEGRGLYTGSFGYYSFTKTMDFNIMIRSLFLTKGDFIFNVGGGITLLSDPREEYEETIYKAKTLWEALGLDDVWEERYCILEKKQRFKD